MILVRLLPFGPLRRALRIRLGVEEWMIKMNRWIVILITSRMVTLAVASKIRWYFVDFMLNFRELFDGSKQSANILMEDLDHFIKSNKIFQSKKVPMKVNNNHMDSVGNNDG